MLMDLGERAGQSSLLIRDRTSRGNNDLRSTSPASRSM